MSLLLFAASIVVFIVLAGVVASLMNSQGEERGKPTYDYSAKRSIMTSAEQEFYNVLGMAVGHEYRIFAQVRLSALVQHRVPNGQSWRAALAHINQKSVDFVLSDKETLVTKLAIELDDKSHEREDRRERDEEVERILKAVGIPLLRIKNHGIFEPEEIGKMVQNELRM